MLGHIVIDEAIVGPNAGKPFYSSTPGKSNCIYMYSIVFYKEAAQAGLSKEKTAMSKTVTLRLDDSTYRLFRSIAERENRPISNFIETAVLRFVEEQQFVDEFEMAEISANKGLLRSLKRGQRDVKQRRGAFV
jgi:predicted transcriptional regulator